MRLSSILTACFALSALATSISDPYATLELKKSANPSPAEIKKAYRRLSLLYHPDKSIDPQAKQKMEQISAAYEQIGDPDKKLIFDEFGTDEKYYSKWHYEQAQRVKGKTVSKKGFYTQSEEVKTLTSTNFWAFSQKAPALINFYASWCTHCQQMVSEYKKTGILLEDVAKVGAVNCEAEQNLCNRYNIQGYPTLMLFTKGGDVETYSGEHTADAIYGWVQQTMTHHVIPMTPQDFSLTNNGSLWIVDFSAGQWCGPCTGLKPSLRRLSSELLGIAKVAIVECDRDQSFCANNGVNYYPQVRLFQKDRLPSSGQLLEVNQNFPAAGMLDLVGTLAKLFLPQPAEPQESSSDASEIIDAEHTDHEQTEQNERHSDL